MAQREPGGDHTAPGHAQHDGPVHVHVVQQTDHRVGKPVDARRVGRVVGLAVARSVGGQQPPAVSEAVDLAQERVARGSDPVQEHQDRRIGIPRLHDGQWTPSNSRRLDHRPVTFAALVW